MNLAALRKLLAKYAVAGASLLLANAVSGCAGSTAPYAPSLSNPPAESLSGARAATVAWSRNLMRVPLPGAGCFRASYPAVVWSRTACVAPAHIAFPLPKRNPIHPATVGNGNDYTLVSLPQVISAAIGSFPNVHGVTSVKSIGYSGSNVYSLQLNSNNFSTAACVGMAHCVGWEQFVYTNQPKAYAGGGNLIIQDWLLSTTSQSLSSCPPGAGWQKSGTDCYLNGPYAVLVPNVPITELSTLSLSGSAAPRGDSAFLAVGATVYGMRYGQGDGVTDLRKHWTGAEFNVVGNGGGTEAVFNSGATITVSLEADTGTPTKPNCRPNSGTTGESNNLSFIAAPTNPVRRRYPSIEFTESNAGGGGSPSCNSLAAR